MKLQDAMIVWTPNRDGYAEYPKAGTAEVTTIPEKPAMRDHPCSAGACDYTWQNTDDEGRAAMFAKLINQLRSQDNISEKYIEAILSQIHD